MLDIQSKITFYGSARLLPKSYISNCVSDDIPPQMNIFSIQLSRNSTLKKKLHIYAQDYNLLDSGFSYLALGP